VTLLGVDVSADAALGLSSNPGSDAPTPAAAQESSLATRVTVSMAMAATAAA
jgi:hypothetical protein